MPLFSLVLIVLPAAVFCLNRGQPHEAAIIRGHRLPSTELRPPPDNRYSAEVREEGESRFASEFGDPPFMDSRYLLKQKYPEVTELGYAAGYPAGYSTGYPSGYSAGYPGVGNSVATLEKRMSLAELLYDKLNSKNRLKPLQVRY
jgi:hypothetical protein